MLIENGLDLTSMKSRQNMPDIAKQIRADFQGELDAVGMSEIELPIQYVDGSGQTWRVPAKAEAFVSLDDANAKGIHMSRLFFALQNGCKNEPVSPKSLEKILREFLETHEGLSESAYLKLSFEYLTERPALVSQNKGWRSYPVTLSAKIEAGEVFFELGLKVLYSSTCPCSAALARQLIQENFKKQFSGAEVSFDQVHEWLGSSGGIIATPHSQRSQAEALLGSTDSEQALDPYFFIELIENALKTPVQAAVKREDEQEFALLNGTNLMFCEDAGRKIKSALKGVNGIADYWVRLEHYESLHPHNAVSVIREGRYKTERPIW